MSMGRTVTNGMSSVAPQASQAALFSPDIQQAMAVHQSRNSLISPRQRHQEEEASSSSVNQEMVMEEVKRQVALAMQGRDQEVTALKQRNEQLERALMEANTAMRTMRTGGTAGRTVGGREGHGDPSGEPGQDLLGGAGAAGVCHGPPGLGLERDGDPQGELPEAGRGEPGLNAGLGASLSAERVSGAPSGGVHGGRDHPGPRFREASADPPGGQEGSVESLQLLVQGMRQLQQVYLGKNESRDSEVKGAIELPSMPELTGDAAVNFSDWLYETEQAVGGLSDRAAAWFTMCLACARETYERYQQSDPIAGLSLEPLLSEELKNEKWSRLERRVLTLLLATLQKQAKDDAITHRVSSVTGLLFRLHVLYAPGGSAERASILRQLEGVPCSTSITETVSSLRRWRDTCKGQRKCSWLSRMAQCFFVQWK